MTDETPIGKHTVDTCPRCNQPTKVVDGTRILGVWRVACGCQCGGVIKREDLTDAAAQWNERCRRVRLEMAAPDLLAACEALVDDDACRLDHHGNCQTHFRQTDDGRCWNAVAKEYIAKATKVQP